MGLVDNTLNLSSNASSNRDHNKGKISMPEYEHLQKKIGENMRLQVSLQSDMIKAMQTYRQACESMALASDTLSKVAGQLAVYTMSAYQTNQEVRSLTGSKISESNETKHKNMSHILQQFVRFHTQLFHQQQAMSLSIQTDFEHPLWKNLDKFRIVAGTWQKNADRDLKRLKADIKDGESKATKASRNNVDHSDLGKLSMSLQELSMKMSEMERVKVESLEQAITTDQYQSMLVSHHLQVILRQQANAFHSTQHLVDISGLTSRRPSSVAISPQRSQNSPHHSPSDTENHVLVPPPRRDSTKKQHLDPKQSDQNKTPKLSSAPGPNDVKHRRVQQQQQQKKNQEPTPPRNLKTTPLMPLMNPDQPLLDASTGKPITIMFPERQRNFPSLYSRVYDAEFSIAPGYTMDEYETDSCTNEESISSTNQYLEAEESHVHPQTHRQLRKQRNRETIIVPREISIQEDTNIDEPPSPPPNPSIKPLKMGDMAVAKFDYLGSDNDELDVLKGDTVKVCAVEQSGWIFAQLMVLDQSQIGGNGYAPAIIHGQQLVGWIPTAYLERLEL